MLTLIGNGHPLSEIGVKTLAGYMEHQHIPARAIYLNNCTRISPSVMKELLSLTDGSRLVGFSVMSKDIPVFLPLVERIRQEQRIPVVWGGIHPTALPEKSLRSCDFICRGEGEEPLRQLYECLANGERQYAGIPNIGYHESGSARINPVTYAVKSLDDLPYPDYKFADSYYLQGFSEGRQLKRIPSSPREKGQFFRQPSFLFYSQRGCKLACTYCSNSLYHRLAKETGVKWYRYASVERIKRELRSHLQEMPFIKTVGLNDDDLLERDVDQLKAIAVFLKQEMKVVFNINATPTHVTREKIAVLADQGLRQVAMGVQSGSARTLREVYKRPVLPGQVLTAAKIIEEFYPMGVRADYGFILDNPYETADDWRDSLRLLSALPKPRTTMLYSLTFFPGTVLTERALAAGFIASVDEQFTKKYHDDIKATYPYFLFFINSEFNVPDRWNEFLLSDFMVKSRTAFLLRWVLGQSMNFYKAKAKINDYLKSSLPEGVQTRLIRALRCVKNFGGKCRRVISKRTLPSAGAV